MAATAPKMRARGLVMRVEAAPVLSGTLAPVPVALPVARVEVPVRVERVAEVTVPLELADEVVTAVPEEAEEETVTEAETVAEAEAELEAAEEETGAVPPVRENWPEKLLSLPWTISRA